MTRPMRRLRRLMTLAFAVVVIGFATVVSLAAVMTPWIASHPDKIRRFLEKQTNHQVQFGAIQGRWTRAGPVFEMHNLQLRPKVLSDGVSQPEPKFKSVSPFVIENAEFALDFYAWLKRGRSFAELRLIGLNVEVERDPKLGWRVARLGDFDRSESNTDPLRNMPTVVLRDAIVTLRDPSLKSTFTVKPVDLGIYAITSGHRIAGRLGGKSTNGIQFVCRLKEQNSRGQCHLAWRDLNLAEWFGKLNVQGLQVQAGQTSGQLWASYRAGQLQSAQVEWNANAVQLSSQTPIARHSESVTPIAVKVILPTGQWAAKFVRDNSTQWRLDVLDLEGGFRKRTQAHARLMTHKVGDRTHYQLLADEWPLGAWPRLAVLPEGISPQVRQRMYDLDLGGTLRDLNLSGTGLDDFSVRGEFVAARSNSVEAIPGVNAIDGEFYGDAQAVVFAPKPNQKLRVEFKKVFRAPFDMDLKTATVLWRRDTNGWWLDFFDIDARGIDIGVRGNASLFVPPGKDKPYLEGHAEVLPSGLQAAKAFWPINVMPKTAVDWLDNGLQAGRLDRGFAALRGDFDDWPFGPNTGHFDAQATVSQVTLKYHPEWPVATDLNALVRFEDAGLRVAVSQATVAKNRILASEGRIDNLTQAVLNLDANGQGEGANLLDLLRQSPIAKTHGEYLQNLELGGHGDVSFNLRQPLGEQALVGESSSVAGSVQLHDSTLVDTRWKLDFDRVNGTVKFSDAGFGLQDCLVHTDAHPAKLNLNVGSDFVRNPKHLAEARLSGILPVSSVLGGMDELKPIFDSFQGQSAWLVNLEIDRDDTPTALSKNAQPINANANIIAKQNTNSPTVSVLDSKRLTLESNLVGTAMNLPAPFQKSASDAMPLRLEMELPMDGGNLSMTVTDVGRLDARLPDSDRAIPFAGIFRFGSMSASPLPARGLRVEGRVNALDLMAWAKFGNALGGDANLPIAMEVQTDQLQLAGRALQDTKVNLAQSNDATVLLLSGAQAQGSVRIPRKEIDKQGITARFEKFHLPPLETSDLVAANAVGDAVEKSVSNEARIDPKNLPPLHLWAKDLKLGHTQFGETRIETFPFDNGMKIDAFDSKSPNFELRARGDWQLQAGVERSSIDANLSSKDLGRMLDAFGFKGLVDGGETISHVVGSWRGAPSEFAVSAMDGTLGLTVGEGRVLDVNPGAGRVFGLLSFTAIPRRLSLDFSDFFKKGMSFDSITGEFVLRDGNAVTQNLQIKAPSAEILIKGRTGLRDRDYDQEMKVTPKVSGALTVVGAIAGGPIGAAAGTLAQGILGGGINQMMKAEYTVKGSWEKPEIALVRKEKLK